MSSSGSECAEPLGFPLFLLLFNRMFPYSQLCPLKSETAISVLKRCTDFLSLTSLVHPEHSWSSQCASVPVKVLGVHSWPWLSPRNSQALLIANKHSVSEMSTLSRSVSEYFVMKGLHALVAVNALFVSCWQNQEIFNKENGLFNLAFSYLIWPWDPFLYVTCVNVLRDVSAPQPTV